MAPARVVVAEMAWGLALALALAPGPVVAMELGPAPVQGRS